MSSLLFSLSVLRGGGSGVFEEMSKAIEEIEPKLAAYLHSQREY
jgi:hypothetical protein